MLFDTSKVKNNSVFDKLKLAYKEYHLEKKVTNDSNNFNKSNIEFSY